MIAPATLILFDIDGTLLIYRGLGRAAKARAMQDIFGTDAGVINHPFGGKTDWQILSEVLGPLGWSIDDIGARMVDYEQAFAVYMHDMLADYPPSILPGAVEVVQALRQRPDTLLGIITGNTGATAPIKLRGAGFDPAWFPVGAYGHEAPERNTLAHLVLGRARARGPVGRTIVIGDTVQDVACARAIDAVAVAVLTGFEERTALDAARPDYTLPDLTHFFDVVPF